MEVEGVRECGGGLEKIWERAERRETECPMTLPVIVGQFMVIPIKGLHP